MPELNRRDFMKTSAGAAVGLGVLSRSTASWAGANDRVRVAVIGLRGRGRTHVGAFAPMENVEIATVCDIDERVFAERIPELMEEHGIKEPKTEWDFRKVLEDDSIDAISIATPNHLHTLISVLACEAGKDVYVEKPLSHNIWEGRQLVQAAEKHNRMVQHGTQIRCSPAVREGVQHLRDGLIGDIYMGKGLCYKWRDTIGHAPEEPVPEGVHYDLWMGPAPVKPFTKNRFHYNWHWQWDYGNGDVGNTGVHQMDILRMALDVDLPVRVSSMGGHFMFEDDQETPNTQLASFWYPSKDPKNDKGILMVFEVRHWITNFEGDLASPSKNNIGNIIYGSEGYMTIDGNSYRTFLGREREPGPSATGEGSPFQNFIECVRSRKRENLLCDVAEGHYSSALCHMANTAYRLRRTLEFDPVKEEYIGDAEANQMLSRVYRKPYVVPGGEAV
ncbi:MAG: Gfo/Idh/MocA family oxidoreductase [Candidatus Omnitrophica bacterium]|nr:Gfo/Idh/MocA family oxidoreductase [Candidatus Omnitrophota bacterium]